MPNALKQYAEARPTPRNKLMGLLADTLTQANEFATLMDPRYENKRQNQTLGLLADAVSLGSIAKTADRMSYGEPLTNAGKANVPFLKPETADALMMAPLSPRNALAMMGAGMADNGMMKAATVWHGSPHKFDKFDASKIGTGDGLQAYGHGLYFTENPEVAKQFLGNNGFGNLYKVDIPDEKLAQMLDWNKPTSEQSALIRQISERRFAELQAKKLMVPSAPTGQSLYNALQHFPGVDKRLSKKAQEANARAIASSKLSAAGVPGVRFDSKTSKTSGLDGSNFVVFPDDQEILRILERINATAP